MLLAISGSRIEAFAQLITLILVFAFVLAITYFTTRFVGNYQKEKMLGSNICILETMRLSNNKCIYVVKIGSQCFAIAVSKDTVTYLCELQEEDLVYKDSSTEVKSESFKAILDKFKREKQEDQVGRK